MSVESSSLRMSEAEHELGSQGSVPQDDQAEQPGSPSIEEIAAVEVHGETEPRLQKCTLLVDLLIRECKCDLSGDEFLKAMRYAGPLVTVRRPTPEELVFDAPPGYFAIHLKSLENGFRFPLESLVIDFFKHFDFLLCQLVPNSHRYLAGFLIRCREMGVRADLERLLTLFRVAKSPGSDGDSFAALYKLCSGGPYEPSALVSNEALAELGFVFHDQDEPKRRVVQSQLEEGPLGQGRRGASKAAGHVSDLEGKLAEAEERARASEARIAAEEKARRLEEESEQAFEAFQASPAFEEAALSCMANYSLGLHRAQEVLLERIRDGKELPKPCEKPEEFDSSIYYSEDEDAVGGGEDTAGN
ncbi:unnamed protein product [Cuscuta campestris]|uniref:Transposase (putative) gypsy type domain-containing protein n=1 Tax=Cuscuta campestris TaxID=132261 RepID=A0A484MCG6_9ASTE|nr:unnamed protein product [Cuscuta campestris]